MSSFIAVAHLLISQPMNLSANPCVLYLAKRQWLQSRKSWERFGKIRTGRLWVDSLITPVTIIHLLLCADRGVWLLHMYALKRIVPHFFTANHFNYARYNILAYIRYDSPIARNNSDSILAWITYVASP